MNNKIDQLTKSWQFSLAANTSILCHEAMLIAKAAGYSVSWWLIFSPLIAFGAATVLWSIGLALNDKDDSDDPYEGL